ncbi:MAG TPA: CHAP domain-containing protein [Ktedonobacteraceae bacterium]
MQTPSSFWQYLQAHRPVRLILEAVGVFLALMTLFLGRGFGTPLKAFAQSACPKGEQTYVVVAGDNLSTIAERYNTSWQTLASSNHLANANLISVDETICIPANAMSSQSPMQTGASGASNPYPYGQCTWWADERYHQLHSVYVPWTNISSDAWQWTDRARAFGWHVSSQPSVGAILNLQPWVQGAYGLGHVAVVEQILSNGDVVASNMNWGSDPGQVTDVTFTPGSGVTFLTI